MNKKTVNLVIILFIFYISIFRSVKFEKCFGIDLPQNASEKIDSPIYASWAKFKPGTKLTFKQTSTIGKQVIEAELIYQLVNVASDSVIVEMYAVSSTNDKSNQIPKVKIRIQNKVNPLLDENVYNYLRAKNSKIKEFLTINNKQYECFVFEDKTSQEYNEVTNKFWYCEDIPGCLVKSEVIVSPNIAIIQQNASNTYDSMHKNNPDNLIDVKSGISRNKNKIKSKQILSKIKDSKSIDSVANTTFIKAKAIKSNNFLTKTTIKLLKLELVR